LIRWLLLPLLLPIVLVVALFFALTDDQPKLQREAQVTLADLERGKAIIKSLGLRHMREGEVRQVVLTESDLDKGVNYLASRLTHQLTSRLTSQLTNRFTNQSAPGSASAHIEFSTLVVRTSLPLPLPMMQRYLNLELGLVTEDEKLKPVQLQIGKLALPANLTGDLMLRGLAHSPLAAELALARTMLNSVQISDQNLAFRFTWHGAAVAKAMGGMVAQGVDETVLSTYHAYLQQTDSRDFTVLLGAAFTLAELRSDLHDPVIENRAALTSLAEMTLGGRLLSRRSMEHVQRKTDIKLAGREDFSQHFALSAFLAATGGEGLSDMAGLYKELKDAQGGSGFSFADLAADRAGSRLGQVSTGSPAAALKMQRRLAGVRDAKVYFPSVGDLPEFMQQAEFQRRFGGVGQPAYQKMVEQIEARVLGVPLYKD
jgi:hypothetical protein